MVTKVIHCRSLILQSHDVIFHFVFCRKSFCGYARVDVDLNYTNVDQEETAMSHSEGLFSQVSLCIL